MGVRGQAKQPLQGKLCEVVLLWGFGGRQNNICKVNYVGLFFMGVRGQAKQPFQGKLCGVVLCGGSGAGKTTFARYSKCGN